VAGPYRQHVVALGDDTCQADLDVWAYSWTYPEVTRVTTIRVTRGMGCHQQLTWQADRAVRQTDRVDTQTDRWQYDG
jgi:hypothetical protein